MSSRCGLATRRELAREHYGQVTDADFEAALRDTKKAVHLGGARSELQGFRPGCNRLHAGKRDGRKPWKNRGFPGFHPLPACGRRRTRTTPGNVGKTRIGRPALHFCSHATHGSRPVPRSSTMAGRLPGRTTWDATPRNRRHGRPAQKHCRTPGVTAPQRSSHAGVTQSPPSTERNLNLKT